MFVYLAMRFMDTEDQTIENLVSACMVTNFFWTRHEKDGLEGVSTSKQEHLTVR